MDYINYNFQVIFVAVNSLEPGAMISRKISHQSYTLYIYMYNIVIPPKKIDRYITNIIIPLNSED